MPPDSLEESPKYSAELDVFSFGHLIVFLVNQKVPLVQYCYTVEDVQKKWVHVGTKCVVEHWIRWVDPIILYTTAVWCLGDTPAQQPTSRDIMVMRMEEICKQHPVSHENTLQVLSGEKKEAGNRIEDCQLISQCLH